MKIDIISPTKAIITETNNAEIESLIKQMSYTLESIRYLLKKHNANYWYKKNNPISWEERQNELKNQLKKSTIWQEEGNYYIRPGSVPYIEKIAYTVNNEVIYPDFKIIPWESPPEFQPYPYQTSTVSKLIQEKHGNGQLATGTGKSYIALLLAKLGLKTIVITPSVAIFEELLVEFTKRFGKRYIGTYGNGKKDFNKLITICVGKSLTMLKEDSEAYQFFKEKQALIWDESHTSPAEQLERVCNGVLSDVPYRWFLSATQIRGDGTLKLLQSIIGKTVYELSIKDAIEQGYLCPLQFNILKVISPSQHKITDPMEAKREFYLRNPVISQFAAKIANSSWTVRQESTLILVEELQQIKDIIKDLTVPYTYVHSGSTKDAAEWGLKTVDSKEEIEKFNKGEVRVLIGTSCISVGVNLFPTHNTINLVGGGSEIETKQGVIGRSTRKLEISKYAQFHKPKTICTIYDFDVIGQPILSRQLQSRIEYYEETGGKISYF